MARQEKVALVGKNGAGKTTLTRMLLQQESCTAGTLNVGHNVDIGYYAQNQTDELDGNMTVLETLEDVAVGDVRKQLRGLLGSFLFTGEDVDKKVKVLSGRESPACPVQTPPPPLQRLGAGRADEPPGPEEQGRVEGSPSVL